MGDRHRAASALSGLLTAVLLASGCSAAGPTGSLPSGAAPASSSAGTAGPSSPPAASAPATTAPRPASPTPAPTAGHAAEALRVRSVENFRDVAGDGLDLPDGSRMATGVVYRSAKLSTITPADLKRLQTSGVELVIDLRTTAVARNSPDPALRGADHRLVNIYGTAYSPRLRTRTVAGAQAYMRGINVGFVADAGQRSRIAQALRLIASADGPVVVHCTEGKDRTGWVSAVLQLAAGADEASVLSEYLASNDYRAEVIDAAFRSAAARKGRQAAEVDRALLTVDASYLKAGLAELKKRYGDIDGYLSDGLGLSRATIAKLRARLTA